MRAIDDELLVACFKRFVEKKKNTQANSSITELFNLIKNNKAEAFDRITISSVEGLHYVQSNNITRIEADGNYSAIHIQDGSKFLSSKNLKSYEVLL